MKLKALIRPETVGGYSISIPALPGCHSEGETFEEAMANIREAAELWLEAAAERGTAQLVDSPTLLCREIDL
jgi:predicted RNase H-like HicB family nuclease